MINRDSVPGCRWLWLEKIPVNRGVVGVIVAGIQGIVMVIRYGLLRFPGASSGCSNSRICQRRVRMMRRGVVRLAVFVLVGSVWASMAVGQAVVEIVSRPDGLIPGGEAKISYRITKSASEPEKRIVVRVDLHNADTDEKVSEAILDNDGQGYKGEVVNLAADVPVPADAAGAYYFKITAAPWSFNRAIVERMKSYPTDGTFTYRWTTGYGVTRDVVYKGSVVAPSDNDNTCYCSGLAFEVFVLAWNDYNARYGHTQIGDIPNASTMQTFRRVWYGNFPETEKLATRAIPEWGAGVEITDWEEAQEGDFVQLWRHSSTGHNPVFVNWIRNNRNQITGVRYWGSQGSSDGIGFGRESFGETRNMDRDRFYLARSAKPRDEADYDWALGVRTTKGQPSLVNSAVGNWAYYE